MEKLNIGLSEKERFGSVEILQKLLADQFVLYAKTRKYHWNVTGLQFKSLHELLEQLYKGLEEEIDATAERIRALGFFSIGTLKQFIHLTRLEEHEEDIGDAVQMVNQLVLDYETLISHMRIDIATSEARYKDVGTADFITTQMVGYEKNAWILRSFQ